MQGLAEARDIIINGTNFLVYFDPDTDGLIAGYFPCRLLNALNRGYSYFVNSNREHGFTLPKDKLKGLTIIAVDFSLKNYEELVEIVDSGANIICIDHHEINSDHLWVYSNGSNKGVVINNQYPFESKDWRFLSGAGVVWRVFSALFRDMALPDGSTYSFDCEEVRALVGITLLSDVRAIECIKARKILDITYKSDSDMIFYLLKQTGGDVVYGFGAPAMDRNTVDFMFSPKINALFRLNRGYDAIRLVLGQLPAPLDFASIKAEQTDVIQRLLDTLVVEERDNLLIAKVKVSDVALTGDYLLSNFIGVACSRLKKGKTTLVMLLSSDGETVLRGSVRGYNDYVDYLSLFRSAGIACGGHDTAFGLSSCLSSRLDFDYLDKGIAILERAKEKGETSIIEVNNLSSWFKFGKSRVLAKENTFCRDKYRGYLKYVGVDIVLKVERPSFFLYCIDGVDVKSFSPDLTPENGLILPILERGYITLYLKESR